MARSLLRGFFSRLHLGSWALFTVAFGFTRNNHNFTSFLFLCMINNKAVVGSAANKTCVCFCMSFEDIFPPHPCHYFHTATKAASTAFPAPVGCNEPSDACQTHVKIFCVYMHTGKFSNIFFWLQLTDAYPQRLSSMNSRKAGIISVRSPGQYADTACLDPWLCTVPKNWVQSVQHQLARAK